MGERCKQCERYETSLKELAERRRNLWRRGELTDAAAEKLAADEQRIAGDLRAHQASEHVDTRPNTPTTEQQRNLEFQIRLRAFELYEARGREDGHDLDDWLQAETELTKKKIRPIAA